IQATPGAEFFGRHRSELLWMAFVALIARPVIFGLHDVLVHQVINPNLSNLIRWQNHRYVLKQSLTFFQNDFAGRIAQRIMQTGFSLRDSAVQAVDALWHVVIYAISAMVLFARADWWLVVPLLVWIGCYIAALSYFVPRVKARSVIATESRSKLMGRIVDGYTNITTLKLFAHTQHEESYARDAMAEQTDKTRLSGRMISGMDFTITAMNGLLIVGTSALALWLWSQGRVSAGT
ncbi:ABC transporter ATP-binding protein/permease, partial [Escherichia coli]|nr:ABC transporter ATP-binding protein/permease [Escherichia coli]